MAGEAPNGTPNVIPFLRYTDASAAIDWLTAAFGFQTLVAFRNDDGSIAHAELNYGPGVIMLGEARDDELRMRSPRDLPAVNQGIYVVIADIAAHHARAAAAGAEIVRGPEDTDYGSREYTARDLEGHLWSFGTYAPGDGAQGRVF